MPHPVLRRVLIPIVLLAASAVHGKPLTPECETELALSALPERLRADAAVYIHDRNTFRQVRDGRTFSCIVERNHPLALIPQCLDRAGAEAILPALIWKSQRILAGEDPAAVRQAHAERLAAGEYDPPARPGVSYMTSAFNRVHIAARDTRISVGPHVMFYAPGVGNTDIGGSQQHGMANRGMPFVIDEGPHGYMISFVERASETAGVEAACGGDLEAFGIAR